jgi:hypothetical protein
MKNSNGRAMLRATVALGAGALVLSGCLGPTYGTDKPAASQFFEDLGSVASLKKKQKEPIQYNPRPGLVKPTDASSLPAPQENIAEASTEWPESPEERLARIRKEADEGKIQPGLARKAGLSGEPKFADQATGASPRDRGDTPTELGRKNRAAGARSAEKLEAKASPTQRKYLTDPPAEYRTPVETAPYGDLGQTESAKERARKKATAETKTGWRKLVPWL